MASLFNHSSAGPMTSHPTTHLTVSKLLCHIGEYEKFAVHFSPFIHSTYCPRMIYDDAEEDFGLGVAPKRAHFSSLTAGASRHLMVNGTSGRMAIKVKCSNNRLFRISPVYTILDPGCAQRLQIVRDPGCPGTDKMVLLWTWTRGQNAREAFEQCDKSQIGRLLIVLDARELGEKPSEDAADGHNGTAPANKKRKETEQLQNRRRMFNRQEASE